MTLDKNTTRKLVRIFLYEKFKEVTGAHLVMKYAGTTGNLNQIVEAYFDLASDTPEVKELVAKLDSPNLWSFTNGVLDFSTLKVSQITRNHFLTKTLFDYSYTEHDPSSAKHKQMMEFLGTIFPDSETLMWLLKSFVFGFLINVPARRIIILRGDGSNGKLTFLQLLYLVAQMFSQSTGTGIMTEKIGTGKNNAELAKMAESRLVFAHECDENELWNTATIKKIVAETVTVQRKFCQPEEKPFKPSMFCDTNPLPIICVQRREEKRRIAIIECTKRCTEHENELGKQHVHQADERWVNGKVNDFKPTMMPYAIHLFRNEMKLERDT